ncbi:tRNA (adenosine(37)-N6)-dimethylallyltransferase MiaA [Wenzhouxiangella sp. XN79A]|nr:tRNA (adenosine(37)-N6)-dimethylallyltransferase MiaA [Wenzhouxiangella sp. XN79A]
MPRPVRVRSAVPPCIVVTGPTAAGKTTLAFALAERFPCRLISVDSAQVYRGLDVGTAKPTAEELRAHPHDLIDIREPEDVYSAAEFVADAQRCIAGAHAAGRLPVLVGGTTMYLNALRYGLDPLPPADPALRAALTAEAERIGWAAMHARLAELDAEAARRIRASDPQRILRALEIHGLTGRPPTQLWTGRGPDRMQDSLMLIVSPADRSELHARIDRRWSTMLAQGLLDEVAALLERPGLDPDGPVMRAVGYRQSLECLRGEYDRSTLVARGAAATRRLAKRQLTALRQWAGGRWYDPLNASSIDRIIRRTGRFAERVGG